MFPLAIALSDLAPVTKVSADYLPPPKNQFLIKVNDEDYYALTKEELDYDPAKFESFSCKKFELNDVEAISGWMTWDNEEVEQKINQVYQGKPLESFTIYQLDCKS